MGHGAGKKRGGLLSGLLLNSFKIGASIHGVTNELKSNKQRALPLHRDVPRYTKNT